MLGLVPVLLHHLIWGNIVDLGTHMSIDEPKGWDECCQEGFAGGRIESRQETDRVSVFLFFI